MITAGICIVVTVMTVRYLLSLRHERFVKRRLELMTLNVVAFNCRKRCGQRARTACGACYECCSRCRSKEANDPAVQRAYLHGERDKDIARMEKENES